MYDIGPMRVGILRAFVASLVVAFGADARAASPEPSHAASPIRASKLETSIGKTRGKSTLPALRASSSAGVKVQPRTAPPAVERVEGHEVVGMAPWGKPIAKYAFEKPGRFDKKSAEPHVALGLPMKSVRSVAPDSFVVQRDGFVSIYDPKVKAPRLVSWKMTPKDFAQKPRSRLDFFGPDPHLHAAQPSLGDYMGAFPEYDAGHMKAQSFAPRTPANERANAWTYTPSNLILQASHNNQGPYLHSELFQKELAQSGRDIYTQAGPLYEKTTRYLGGKHDIPVPSHVFKVVVSVPTGMKLSELQPNDPRLQVFSVIIPNNNKDVAITDSFAKYAVPVRQVMQRTGYSGLLSDLPPAVRTSLMKRSRVDVVHHTDGSATVDGHHVPAFKSPFQNRNEKREAPSPAPKP